MEHSKSSWNESQVLVDKNKRLQIKHSSIACCDQLHNPIHQYMPSERRPFPLSSHPLPPTVFHCPPSLQQGAGPPNHQEGVWGCAKLCPPIALCTLFWYARCWAMKIFDTLYSPDLLNSRQSQTPCQKACVDTCPLLMYSIVGNGNEHHDGGCWPYWAPIYLCITIGPWLLDL